MRLERTNGLGAWDGGASAVEMEWKVRVCSCKIFSSSLPTLLFQQKHGYYAVFGLSFSDTQCCPCIDSRMEEIEGFYDLWYNFDSWRVSGGWLSR